MNSLEKVKQNRAEHEKIEEELQAFTYPKYNRQQELNDECGKLIADAIREENILSLRNWRFYGGYIECDDTLHGFKELEEITDYKGWFYPHGSINLSENIELICNDAELCISFKNASNEELSTFLKDYHLNVDVSEIDGNIEKHLNTIRNLELIREKFTLE